MSSSSRFVKSKELKEESDDLLRELTDSGDTCYITQDGKAKAVLMDIQRYNALMDLVEESESLKQKDVGEETRKQASVKVIIKKSTTRRIARSRRR